MNVSDIFYNQFGRLRSGWRFLIFQLLIIFTGAVVGQSVNFVLLRLPIGYAESSLLAFIVPNLILLFLALFCGWLCGKFLEDLPFRALGAAFTKNWLKDFSFGLLLGSVSIGFAVLIAVAFGGMRFEVNQNAGASAIILTLGVSLAVFTVGAAAEEAFFHGYILQTFLRAKLVWLSIILTSLIFAFAHTNNPSANWISTFNTLLAGIWFGVAYLKTRNLWFPFGLHLTWNWLQGAFFGIPVSGITELTTAPFLKPNEMGADVIGGGQYGIEGGLACTTAVILSTVLIHFLPIFKPNEEMLTLTSEEKLKETAYEALK